MKEVLQFFKENPTFFIATVDGDMPKVRPFGFVMEWEGHLAFCTNNQKEIYRQLQKNPQTEICTCSSDGRWLRVSGSVDFVTDRQAKEKALSIMPELKAMYSADDDIFEIFVLLGAKAKLSSMQGESRDIEV